jgi:hypothetical protein
MGSLASRSSVLPRIADRPPAPGLQRASALPPASVQPGVSPLPPASARPPSSALLGASGLPSAPLLWRSWTPRAVLILACALSIGAAVWVSDPTAYLQADPALARLLRGMALIKAAAVLTAVAAVMWRFERRVALPLSVTYVVGSSALAGTTMLIWQLTWIAAAAVAFHAALLGLLLAAWRDDGRPRLSRRGCATRALDPP